MDSKIYNTLNQLCNRLAILENKVNKGITVEGGNSSKILNLGDTLRFNSSGGLQTSVSSGSVNVSHDALNIAHCPDIDPTFINIDCGVRGALGMPEPDILLSFGQADALWFNQQDLTLWLFLWFGNNNDKDEPISDQNQINTAVKGLHEFTAYIKSDGNVDTSKVNVYTGHYDVFKIQDGFGGKIRAGPIFPIIRVVSSTVTKNYVDYLALSLNDTLSNRRDNLYNLGVPDTCSFYKAYSDATTINVNSTTLFDTANCSDMASVYRQDATKCDNGTCT